MCLNGGEDLINTVKSALGQTYKDFEIIIKDGGSTDNSIEKLPKDAHIKLIQKKDAGIYEAMNQGISESEGEYLLFMNAGDCFYDSQALENIANSIRGENADIFYGKSYNITLKMFDVCPPYVDKYFCFRSMICHQATIYKAELMKKRGYDTEYRVSADRERLMYAVIKEKITPVFIPVNIVLFQGGGLSASIHGKECIKKEDKKLIQRYFTRHERIKYRIKYMITLPHLRKIFTKNVYTYRVYKKIVGKIYGT